jgi:hypothetical protein
VIDEELVPISDGLKIKFKKVNKWGFWEECKKDIFDASYELYEDS